jgi:predicted DsbA family dithiol-disulfide isomerase
MIKVEVWSDINCPFCYIGKRHLEQAIKKFERDVKVEWKSFELDPTGNPSKGASQEELLAQKYGRDVAWAREMNQNITQMAKDAGLDFNMQNVVPANSFNAHRLLHLAKSLNKQNELKEALLEAKFVRGIDIGSISELTKISIETGINQEDLKKLFEHEDFTKEVRADEFKAQQLGIRGVPFFVVNNSYGLSGAQPVEAFIEVFQKLEDS